MGTEPGIAPEDVAFRARMMRWSLPFVTTAVVQRVASWASFVPPLRRVAYEIASMAFMRRHVCRMDNFPLVMMAQLSFGRSTGCRRLLLCKSSAGLGPNVASMNLQEFDETLPDDWQAIVLHEFGHVLSFEHKHQNPNSSCEQEYRWDDEPGYVPTKDTRADIRIAFDSQPEGGY